MMTGKNAATLRAFVDLLSGGDADRAFKLLHPDVVVHEADALPYSGTYHGVEGFGQMMEQLFGTFDLQINKYEVLDAGDSVIARMEISLTARSSGRSIDMPIVELYRFTDGLISEVDIFYKDTKAVAEISNGPSATPNVTGSSSDLRSGDVHGPA
jgi:ketosteroid isomerase-like protein